MEDYIVLDYMTPKRVKFFKSLDYLLQKEGYKIIRIARDYGETLKLLEQENLNYDVVLKWGKNSLHSKLKAYADNINLILEYIHKKSTQIKAFITLMDPSISRVAYGLSKHLINFSDLPDAQIPGKLSLSLSNYVYIPFCIPKNYITEKYCISKDKVKTYSFLDPVLWLKDYKIKSKDEIFYELGISQKYLTKKLIYARLEPLKANYYMNINHKESLIIELTKEIIKKYGKDVFIILHPRYNEKIKLFNNIKNIKVIEREAVDSISIAANSDLFIGGGGTINIESIYFKTPVISVKPTLTLYEKYLLDNNLSYRPSDVNDKNEILEIVEKILFSEYKRDLVDISKLWEGDLKEGIKNFQKDFLSILNTL